MSSTVPSSTPTKPGHHQALVIAEKGASHSLVTRATPRPGPGQLLIQVKAIALNPVDYFQRDKGAFITTFPTVLGSDIAGIVADIGPDIHVPFQLQAGSSRVTAYASSFFHKCDPDFGSFQQYVLVGAEKVAPLPDSISFAQGAILPMSVSVALSAWWTIGIVPPWDTKFGHNNINDSSEKKRGMLVWSAATSVGSAAVQSAKSMGFRVYATASPIHHEYVHRTLGADRVFDYKSATVVSEIVHAIKEDDVSLHQCFLGRGELEPISSILSAVKSDNQTTTAQIASAPIVPPDAADKLGEGVQVKFVLTPRDPKEAHEYFRWAFNEWLNEKLAAGEYVPSPALRVVGQGLGALDRALDELKAGVSGTKLVVEL